MNKTEEKEQIVIEYLSGDTSSRKLGIKYGYGSSTICRWVMTARKKKEKLELLQASMYAAKQKEAMPIDVKSLQEELHNAQLEICLLKAMIDISDEQFGTNIRKKAGTRPSSK